jgi:hypothetical protein
VPFDLGQPVSERRLRLEAGNLVGVQGNSAEEGGILLDHPDREPRAGQVAADLDHPRDPDRGSRGDGLADVAALLTVARDVQVEVVVDDVDGQRVRSGRYAARGLPGARRPSPGHRLSRPRASGRSRRRRRSGRTS